MVVQIMIVVLIAAILMAMANDVMNCRRDGGKAVRGIFWVECLERTP
jgi:hypothetical protein